MSMESVRASPGRPVLLCAAGGTVLWLPWPILAMSQAKNHFAPQNSEGFLRHVIHVTALGLAAMFAVAMAAVGSDPAFRARAWVLASCIGLVIIVLRAIPFGRSAEGPKTGYLDSVIRCAAPVTVFWGLVGVVIAAQRAWPELNVAPRRRMRGYHRRLSGSGSKVRSSRPRAPWASRRGVW